MNISKIIHKYLMCTIFSTELFGMQFVCQFFYWHLYRTPLLRVCTLQICQNDHKNSSRKAPLSIRFDALDDTSFQTEYSQIISGNGLKQQLIFPYDLITLLGHVHACQKCVKPSPQKIVHVTQPHFTTIIHYTCHYTDWTCF